MFGLEEEGKEEVILEVGNLLNKMFAEDEMNTSPSFTAERTKLHNIGNIV